jgi:hypothetical protein
LALQRFHIAPERADLVSQPQNVIRQAPMYLRVQKRALADRLPKVLINSLLALGDLARRLAQNFSGINLRGNFAHSGLLLKNPKRYVRFFRRLA